MNKLLRYFFLLFMLIPIAVHAVDSKKDSQQLAVNFTLKSLHDKNIKLSELRGKVVMLYFWASWCGQCVQQFPVINQLYKQYQENGFIVLAINIEQDNLKAINIAQKYAPDFPVLFDAHNQVSRIYDVEAMPAIVLIDRDGYKSDLLDVNQSTDRKKTRFIIEGLLNE